MLRPYAMNAEPDATIPTRESLLSRLKNWDDQTSWQSFFDTYWKLFYNVARQAGLTDAEAQDVVQETIIGVARKMPEFKYDPAAGSFKGWLLQITRRRIVDQFRKKHYHSGGQRLQREEPLHTTLLESQAATPSNFEQLWEEEWTRHMTEAALERVKRKISPRHYQIFCLHVCKNLAAREVARCLDVKLAEVYYAKYTVTRLLRKQLHSLETEMRS